MDDIASQAQLSRATVDRVLHSREGASPRAIRAVERAVGDLDRQADQLRLGSRALVVDLVMQAPERFSTAVRLALEAELDGVRPAAVRARFHLRETADPDAAVDELDRIASARSPSAAVLLKAPDDPAVGAAVRRLAAAGVPVVTLVTDIHDSERIAYVGLDNSSAGATAAYLANGWLGRRRGDVLVSLSRTAFFGESERLAAFETALRVLAPRRRVVALPESDGLDATMHRLVAQSLRSHAGIVAVYSVGGGNRAILRAFEEAGRRCEVFVAHDLDHDNIELLLGGHLTAVLHHDLRADMRQALHQVLRHHRLLRGASTSVLAGVQVVTPHNLPSSLRP